MQFYPAASDAEYRYLARKLIEASPSIDIIDNVLRAATMGNDDFVALVSELGSISIEPAILEEIVTAATDGFFNAFKQQGSAQLVVSF